MSRQRKNTHPTQKKLRQKQASKLAFLFAPIALLCLAIGVFGDIEQVQFLSAGIVYIGVLLLRGQPGAALVTLLYGLGALFFSEHLLYAFRVCIFGIVLGVLTLPKRRPPPFIIIGGLWSLLLFWQQSIENLNLEFLLPPKEQFAAMMFTEVLATIFGGFLFLSRRFMRLLKLHQNRIPLVVLINDITTSIIFSGVFAAMLTYAEYSGQSLGTLFESLLSFQEEFLASAAALLLLSWLGSFALASAFRGFLDHLPHVANPNSRIYLSVKEHLPVEEFHRALLDIHTEIDRADAGRRELEMKANDLTLKTHNQESLLQKLQLRDITLGSTLNHAPFGTLVVNGEGKVLEANKLFRKLLGFGEGPTTGVHITKLDTTHAWHEEIRGIFSFAMKTYRKLLQQGFLRYTSSSIHGVYLDIQYVAIPLREMVFDPSKRFAHISPSDMAIAFFVTETKDLRQYKLDMLRPSRQQILDSVITEIARQMQHQVEEIADTLSQMTTQQEVQEVTLNSFLQASLDYLSEFHDLHSRISLAPISQRPSPPLSDKEENLVSDAKKDFFSEPNVRILASQVDLAKLSSELLALLVELAPRAPMLSVSVGHETIGDGTANIFPGWRPGQFARTVLHQDSQTLRMDISSGKLHYLLNSEEDQAEIQRCLSLVTFQVRRMNGFVSIESTQQKGTTIAIYLPLDTRAKETESESPTTPTA